MGIIARIKGWFDMLFKSKAKEEFKIEPVTSIKMEVLIRKCERIYKGDPDWVDPDEHIKTVNFAKTICSEIGRLTMLGTSIQIGGSARAEWLQGQIDAVYSKIRSWTEYGAAYGTIILKASGTDDFNIDMYAPERFVVTDHSNGEITGAVFITSEISSDGKTYYTLLEYHRFLDNGLYAISNKCYKASERYGTDTKISIEKTPWKGTAEETVLEGLEQPLFAVLKMPQANNIDIDSPLSLPAFTEAIEELKDLDIAYSRNVGEIFDSERITLVDDRLTMESGVNVNARPTVKIARHVKNVYGNDSKEFYQEINPQLNTETRLTGINALLSQIGFKCGFSNGYFVFNEKTGMITATQVESDDRRTIQTIKDVRDQLESCLDQLIYVMNAYADLYDYAPAGEYEVVCDFGDITYNREEDRARWWSYVVQGKVPAWMYFVKFEGFSKEEAVKMVNEAQPKVPKLFEEE